MSTEKIEKLDEYVILKREFITQTASYVITRKDTGKQIAYLHGEFQIDKFKELVKKLEEYNG